MNAICSVLVGIDPSGRIDITHPLISFSSDHKHLGSDSDVEIFAAERPIVSFGRDAPGRAARVSG